MELYDRIIVPSIEDFGKILDWYNDNRLAEERFNPPMSEGIIEYPPEDLK